MEFRVSGFESEMSSQVLREEYGANVLPFLYVSAKVATRNSKLQTRNSTLDTRNSKLETQNSKLRTHNSAVARQVLWLMSASTQRNVHTPPSPL
ncbi:MAG: hypothetical protein QOJ64_3958 [Acidobacteriota bacterium]|nr:hypothetical protein [Acidobacteriota bacterium]